MLGGEQDCYGGCTDAGQAFYGLMDEVGHILTDLYNFHSWCQESYLVGNKSCLLMMTSRPAIRGLQHDKSVGSLCDTCSY